MARALISTIIDHLGSLIALEFKDRLGSLFASEVTSIVNVEEEVEKLKLKFQAIQAKLDDAEERQVKEKAVKLWLERLKDVSYEMDDVLDEWNTAKIKADIEKEEEAETSTAKRRKWKEWIGIGGQEEEDCIIIMPRLQKLEIWTCPRLKSLPDFLFKTSLQEFSVKESPILHERYQRGPGEDWAKISHIPNIQIDGIAVQRDGQEVIRRDDEEEFDEEEQSEDEEEGQ